MMNAQEIRDALRAQLADFPTYPDSDNDTASGWNEYDEALNIALEDLAMTCRAIVAEKS